jgi:hypothetical protein
MYRKTLLLIAFLLAATTSFADGKVIDFLISGVTTIQGSVSGGSVYAYSAGTTTLKNIYSDAAMTTALDNPADLDIDGRLVAYGSGVYKFVIKDEFGNTVFTADNVEVNSVQNLIDEDEDPFGETLTQTNLIVTNLSADDAVINTLQVATSAVIVHLDVDDTIITSVGNASDSTDAVNLGQVEALLASYTPDLSDRMELDGSNASTSVTFTNVYVATATAETGATNLGQVEALITALTYLPATTTVPLATDSTGIKGTLSYDTNYLYLCVDTNQWIRIASDSW